MPVLRKEERAFFRTWTVKNYYVILGVSPSAGEAEIRKAFRKLAVQYHPDKNSSPDAKARFQEINEAYDVLGDPVKRNAYDTRLSNPFAEIFSAPVYRHRDPAYKRRPRQRRPQEPPASYVLMRDFLPYVIWISRIGLLVSVLIFVDYFLPYSRVKDFIRGVATYGSASNEYTIIRTTSGHEFRVPDFQLQNFPEDGQAALSVTQVFKSIIYVSNPGGSYKVRVAYMYSELIFFPILLFVNSFVALVCRKRVEFCFNLNLTAFILLIINLILI